MVIDLFEQVNIDFVLYASVIEKIRVNNNQEKNILGWKNLIGYLCTKKQLGILSNR
jgi:hypothetical protein